MAAVTQRSARPPATATLPSTQANVVPSRSPAQVAAQRKTVAHSSPAVVSTRTRVEALLSVIKSRAKKTGPIPEVKSRVKIEPRSRSPQRPAFVIPAAAIGTCENRWMNQPDTPEFTQEELGAASQAGRDSRARTEEASQEIRFAVFCNSLSTDPSDAMVSITFGWPSQGLLTFCAIIRSKLDHQIKS